jgi:hypothetical protein
MAMRGLRSRWRNVHQSYGKRGRELYFYRLSSTPGASTFWDFDGIANTSIGTVISPLTDLSSNPVPSNSNNNWGVAFGTVSVTVDLANPVSYIISASLGVLPTQSILCRYYDGSTLLNTYTGSGLNITQFHDTPGTGFFNIVAGGRGRIRHEPDINFFG